ncbi:MAG: hypothetical protein RL885_29595 [Planctomycetota bacterium]
MELLRHFLPDRLAMDELRQVALRLGHQFLSSWTDQRVIEQLAKDAAAGRLGIRPIEITSPGGNRTASTKAQSNGSSQAPPPATEPRSPFAPSKPRPDLPNPPAPVPAPTETHWIEILLVDPTSKPVPGERVAVTLPDGRRIEQSLDGQGKLRIEDIEVAGTCTIELPNLKDLAPQNGAPSSPPPADTTTRLRPHRKKPLALDTDLTHLLVLARPRVVICELEDATFDVDREILLPGSRADADADPDPDRITGLSVIKTVLEFGAKASDMKLLVAGHTDTTGSGSHNLALSERRAENVFLYLTGQREAWAEHCAENQEVADWQRVLKWISETHGWDCDPGDVDNDFGPATDGARKRFRQTCQEELGLSLGHGTQSAADWAAYFDLFDRHLATLLDVEPAELASLRSAIRFTEPARIGCGEHWPNEAVGVDGYACQDNRRVDLMFFEDGDEPPLSEEDTPGESLYGTGRYLSEYLPVDVESAFERVILHDAFGMPLPNVRWRARGGGEVLKEDTTDGDGVASFRKRCLPERFTFDWANEPGGPILYHAVHVLTSAPDGSDEAVEVRLANLGYTNHQKLEDNVCDLQLELSQLPTGQLEDVRDIVVMWHDHGILPEAAAELDAPDMEPDPDGEHDHVCGMIEED